MAGPTPMALGPYQFEAIGFGFNEISGSLETPWTEVEVAMRMEALHWVGPKKQTETIKGALFPAEFGGQSSLDGLKAAAKRGQVLTLATRDGGIHGRYVIQGIEEDRTSVNANGTPRKNAYQIKLQLKDDAGGANLFAGLAGAIGSFF